MSDDSRLRRVVRATGALAGITSLAGCPAQSGADGADGESGDSVETTTATATEPTASTTDSGKTDTATATPDCESRVSNRESELASLDNRLETAELNLKRARESAAAWRAKRAELPGGHPEERIEAARTVAAEIRESVVVINAGSGLGTGWFIDDGMVMTNAHNIAQFGRVADDITGYTLDGTALEFDVVDFVADQMPDVALLGTASTTRPALSLASGSDLDPGIPLVMVGHPGGVGHWVVSLGLYISKSNDGDSDGSTAEPAPPGMELTPSVKTSVPGRQGNSGSPMVTLDGSVVAMLNASQTRDQDGTTTAEKLPVTEPFVYDWPVSPRAWSVGVPVETVRERYKKWV